VYIINMYGIIFVLNLCSITIELIRETIAVTDYINEEVNLTACDDTNDLSSTV